jgi:hypothetical protein
MSLDATVEPISRPKRRGLQFSLRTLLLPTLFAGLFFAWIGNILVHVHHQRKLLTHFKSLGGKVYYDYQLSGRTINATPPPGPSVVRFFVGDDAFAHVEYVSLDYQSKPTDTDLVLLSNLPRLKDVGLYGPGITDKGMEHVAQVRMLRSLT